MSDWGLGRYELTAAELEPVAERVVAMAAPLRSETVIDIACGTGNAALLAARFKAKVTGFDLTPRLLEVARQRAEAEGLEVTFVQGNAEQLSFPDRTFDVALSVFGLIFASSPEKAFSEMVRVLRPGGRAFFTVWLPGGPIDSMVNVCVKHVNAATGQTPDPSRLHWDDEAAVRQLADRNSVTVKFHEGALEFSDDSPEAFLKRNQENHPMSVATRPLLEKAGTFNAVYEESLQVLNAGNEDPAAFKVTSRYRVVEIRR
ncbi:MAG TPA: class I SAM-dependent methyltransferase [Actinomycetota bacterium]|nr:class I SAM-dependent methyltransferase [Actinomycetota bacterium]